MKQIYILFDKAFTNRQEKDQHATSQSTNGYGRKFIMANKWEKKAHSLTTVRKTNGNNEREDNNEMERTEREEGRKWDSGTRGEGGTKGPGDKVSQEGRRAPLL